MRGSAFHQANATVTALSHGMATIRNGLVDSINALSTQVTEDLHSPHEVPPPPPPIVQDPQVLAAVSNQNALLTAIQDMQVQIRNLTSGTPSNRNTLNNRNPRHGSTYNTRRNTSKYFWSHGACAHKSADCNTPATGHKRQATLANKMGGSTAHCDATQSE